MGTRLVLIFLLNLLDSPQIITEDSSKIREKERDNLNGATQMSRL